MNREYHRWFSPALGRDMEMLTFGHAGSRVLVFPTSKGRFYDWENRGMIDALAEHLEKGWIQLFCVDSVDTESWYADNVHAADKAKRHIQYEQHILNEVLPLTQQVNDNPYLIVTGASFGAYHAINFAFRNPNLVGRVIGLSGIYAIDNYVAGYSDENVHSNNPCASIRDEHDPQRLASLRKMDIIIAVGQDNILRPNNDHLSQFLWDKNIWHAYRVWDGWAHDWPFWHHMIRLYIGGAN